MHTCQHVNQELLFWLVFNLNYNYHINTHCLAHGGINFLVEHKITYKSPIFIIIYYTQMNDIYFVWIFQFRLFYGKFRQIHLKAGISIHFCRTLVYLLQLFSLIIICNKSAHLTLLGHLAATSHHDCNSNMNHSDQFNLIQRKLPLKAMRNVQSVLPVHHLFFFSNFRYFTFH